MESETLERNIKGILSLLSPEVISVLQKNLPAISPSPEVSQHEIELIDGPYSGMGYKVLGAFSGKVLHLDGFKEAFLVNVPLKGSRPSDDRTRYPFAQFVNGATHCHKDYLTFYGGMRAYMLLTPSHLLAPIQYTTHIN
jgi:hypothetical protein